MQQRSHQVSAHPLPQGQESHRGVEEIGHVQQLGEHSEALPVVRVGDAVEVADQFERVAQRQVVPQLASLSEDRSDVGGVGATVLPGHPTRHLDHARGGYEDPGEHLDGGGFPRPVRPQVTDEFPRRDVEGHVVDGDLLHLPTDEEPTHRLEPPLRFFGSLEDFPQVAHMDQRRGCDRFIRL